MSPEYLTSLDISSEYRQQFPALSNKSYFNYGGQGTLPTVALEAIAQSYNYIQTAGPFSLGVNNWVNQEASLTREAIAQELGVTAQTISLTEDVTVGCNIALWGLPWQAGDHILLSDCEHPGIIAAVGEICRRFGVTSSTFPVLGHQSADQVLGAIAAHLQPQTRLVVISHVLWNTGQILPLKEINQLCHAQNCLVLVDAAQSVGQIPLDLEDLEVDFYAFTGHKWFCGPEGLGGLYVSPRVREDLHPTFIGWRGITQQKTWLSDGRRYEVATSAFPLYAGLRAAIALHHQAGTKSDRYRKILQLSQYLIQQLANIPQIQITSPQTPVTGLVCFQVVNPDSTKSRKPYGAIVAALESQGIFTRTLAHPDCIRACVHYFTVESEIDRLVEMLNNLISD
jgi:L-cysteine/cystine lyase